MHDRNLARFGVSIDGKLLARFDKLISEKGYVNRSEAIRDLIRDTLLAQQVENPDAEAFGTLTMIYNHHHGDITDRLNHLQHDYYRNIVSTTHIHLDEHNCLEVIILRGGAGLIKSLSEMILSTKNVRHGKFVIASTGHNLEE